MSVQLILKFRKFLRKFKENVGRKFSRKFKENDGFHSKSLKKFKENDGIGNPSENARKMIENPEENSSFLEEIPNCKKHRKSLRKFKENNGSTVNL